MTVSNTLRYGYASAAGVGPYTYNYQILSSSEFEVYVAGILVTNYTLTGVGNPAGGTFTFVTAPAAGQDIFHRGKTDPTQQTDYDPFTGAPFTAVSHEGALDKGIVLHQEHAIEEASRTPALPVYASTADRTRVRTLPLGATSRLLGYDSTGVWTTYPVTVAPTIVPFDHLGNYGQSLVTAVASIGASKRSLYVLTAAAAVASHLTVPANITVHVLAEGSLTVNAGVTLTIAAPLVAPPVPILFGEGTFALRGPAPLEWWGVSGSATPAANSLALQKAIIDHAGRGTLYLHGNYTFARNVVGPRYYQGVGSSGVVQTSRVCAVVRTGLTLDMQGHTATITTDGTASDHKAWLGGSEAASYTDITIRNGALATDATGGGMNGVHLFDNHRILIEGVRLVAGPGGFCMSRLVLAEGCTHGTLRMPLNAPTFGGLGVFGYCDIWRIHGATVIWSNATGDEILDINRVCTDFIVGDIVLNIPAGGHIDDCIDINSAVHVQVGNLIVTGSCDCALLVLTKDCDPTFAAYRTRLAGANPTTGYQPCFDIQIRQVIVTGTGTGAVGHVQIGNTPSAHGPGSLVRRVQIGTLNSHSALVSGLYVRECADLQIHQVLVQSPGGTGIVLESDTAEPDGSISSLQVNIDQVSVRDAQDGGLLIKAPRRVQIGTVFIESCNLSGGSHSHLRLASMDVRAGVVLFGNVLMQRNAGGFRGLDIQGMDSSCRVHLGTLRIVESGGVFSDKILNIPTHTGVHHKRVSVHLGDDLVANDADQDWPFFAALQAGLILRARLVVGTTISGSDTNYITFRLRRNVPPTPTVTTIASITTQITGGIGTLVAKTAIAIDDTGVGDSANKTFDIGDVLSLAKLATGTGQNVTGVTLVVDYLDY